MSDGLIPVATVAGDGLTVVWHTPAEYARLMAGVDVEASWLMAAAVRTDL